ncbi:hypothetical protein [Mycobacterium talmoniae]|uniref:Uncharacterized protein n=1 Tax=Mycobacterium talmoniae TaxID=1858794 RepID=A0A1S1NFF2_9MYCO|nr:hypothetical protein [Mycobacterium talmoniae]OHU99136.1 hypothetical protein BKN37_19630 [Mycobacterium talmoniae]
MTGSALASYRLHVIAPTVADAVQHAGGWLFDHVMAGWKVTVALADPVGAEALQILGAAVAALDSGVLEEIPRALAVSAELYTGDPRVRRLVRDAADHPDVEVLLWEAFAAAAEYGVVRYRLGAAARAFKTEALVAAGGGGTSVPLAETFRTVAAQRVAPYAGLATADALSQG